MKLLKLLLLTLALAASQAFALTPSPVAITTYGAKCDGSTNDNAAITKAIALLSNGGTVTFPQGATCATSSSITLTSGVTLDLNGSTLLWTGTGSPVITTASTGVTLSPGIRNGTINGGSTATKLLELKSVFHGAFNNLNLVDNNATDIGIDLLVNTTGPTNPDVNYNNVYNIFTNTIQTGNGGTCIRMTGNSTPTVVTLNTFVNTYCTAVNVRGVEFVSWADSNHFIGITDMRCVANNCVGVEVNTGSPTTNVGVYEEIFDTLSSDCFGTKTGRVGLKLNYTKGIKVGLYEQFPLCESGDFVTTVNTISYDVLHDLAGSGFLSRHMLNTSFASSDFPTFEVASDGSISTQTVGVVVGVGRTGSGFAHLDLVGDTTNTVYGLQLIRGNGGANATSNLNHHGNGNLTINTVDSGAQTIISNNGSTRWVSGNTGIGFFGAVQQAQPTTAGAGATFVVSTGTALNSGSTFDGYTLSQVVKALRNLQLLQ